VLCASPDYLEAHGAPQHLDELASHVTLQATGITPTPEWLFREHDSTRTVPIQPRLVTTTNDSAIVAATAGLGIVRLLSYQVADELAQGTLRVVLADYELAALPVHVVHREGKHANHKVRAFIDLAIETLRAEAATWCA